MDNAGKVILLLSLSALINVVAKVKAGDSFIGVLIGTGILFAFMITLGNLWRWDIVMIFTVLIFLSSLLLKGSSIIDVLTGLVGTTK